MNTTKNGKGYYTTPGTFYRTGKGRKAHASSSCANERRSIFTGDIKIIPAAELAGWSGCQHCCDAAEMALLTASVAAPVEEYCTNSGVVNPRRIYSECRDCGKDGKVNRFSGRIKKHIKIVN